MDGCLRVLGEGKETQLDMLLATQVKCHIISNQLTCPPVYESVGGENWTAPAALITALLSQLRDIRQKLPAHILSHSENLPLFQIITMAEKILTIYSYHTVLLVQYRTHDSRSPAKQTERPRPIGSLSVPEAPRSRLGSNHCPALVVRLRRV